MELDLAAFHLEQARILLGERVLGLREDLHQLLLVQLVQGRENRQTPDEFRDQTVMDQVLGLHGPQHLANLLGIVLALDLGAEADSALLGGPILDNLDQTIEGAAADEQNVRGVHLQELLLRVLAASLGRHRRDGALDELQQRLLHALAGYVTGNRRIVGLA